MQLEVVVTTAAEAAAAQSAGATRVELVAEFASGGVTPEEHVVDQVVNAVEIPVHVMLRPHSGGFYYTGEERPQIVSAAERMRTLGASALVFGALDARGRIDVDLLKEVASAGGLPLTFHRAFDTAANLSAAYAVLAAIPSVQWVLTAGGAASAWEGRAWLRELSAGNTIPTVLAGGGIDADNLSRLLRFARVREVHVGRGARSNGHVDAYKVERLVKMLDGGSARHTGK